MSNFERVEIRDSKDMRNYIIEQMHEIMNKARDKYKELYSVQPTLNAFEHKATQRTSMHSLTWLIKEEFSYPIYGRQEAYTGQFRLEKDVFVSIQTKEIKGDNKAMLRLITYIEELLPTTFRSHICNEHFNAIDMAYVSEIIFGDNMTSGSHSACYLKIRCSHTLMK